MRDRIFIDTNVLVYLLLEQDGQIIEDRLRIMNPFSEKTGSKGRF